MNEAPAGLTSRFPLPRVAAALTLLIVAYGYLIASLVRATQLNQPLTNAVGVFHRLFALHEPLGMVPLAFFALLVFDMATKPRWQDSVGPHGAGRSGLGRELFPTRPVTASEMTLLTWGASITVLAATLLGTFYGMEQFPLSMDEFNVDFEARILLAGHFRSTVPDEWRPVIAAIKPGYVSWQEERGVWLSSYLPGNALLRAFMSRLSGSGWITNPLLAAMSVPLIMHAARRLWPGDNWRALFCGLALVTSSQFLATSMTAYALSAHLLFNLIFLTLYLLNSLWGKRIAPLVGAVALGLHNPFPHALFVTPFLVRLLRERKWGLLGWWVSVYGLASVGWLLCLASFRPTGEAGDLLALFAVPGLALWVMQGMNLTLLLSWQSPVVALLALAAVFGVRRLATVERDLVFGVVITFGFYLIFPSDQGHGWGYRYTYSVLGSLVLIAGAALPWLMHATSAKATRRMVTASFAVSILIQLPHRAKEIFSFVQPISRGMKAMESIDADVLLVDADSIWYGLDLVRNDPLFEQRPVVVNRGVLSREQEGKLRARYGPRLRAMETDDLVAMGFERVQPMQPRREPD